MQRQVFHLKFLLLLISANCFLHSVYEEFYTKQILFTNTILRCSDQATQPLEALICSKGMDLLSYDKKIKYIIKFRTQQLTLNLPTSKSNYILMCMVILLLMLTKVYFQQYLKNLFNTLLLKTYFFGQIILIMFWIKQ
ncbi:unnamed protein product [Paramecium primaurelia]|uniref:Transmembrane protein n=1 Tax=Paramecium primaurelia TaxID=5886 RepID=A0A8S1Q9R3_PARPR|nr:unnamed protein product [Paramecium primaurelia]